MDVLVKADEDEGLILDSCCEDAAAVPEDRLEEMISKESEKVYNVESFEQVDIVYRVWIKDVGEISCSCSYFKFNSQACKHMYLLKRKTKNEVEVVSRMETLLAAIAEPSTTSVISETSVAPPEQNKDGSISLDVLKRNLKLEIDSFRHLKRNVTAMREGDREDVELILKKLKEIREIFDRCDRTLKMGTQRNSNN